MKSQLKTYFPAINLLIGPGDSFAAGDVLLEIETDKAQMDVEAQDDGILAKIIVCLAKYQLQRALLTNSTARRWIKRSSSWNQDSGHCRARR